VSTNHHYNTFSHVLVLPQLATKVNFLLLAALPKSSPSVPANHAVTIFMVKATTYQTIHVS